MALNLWTDPDKNLTKTKKLAYVFIWVICFIVIVFLIWARYAHLDEVTRGYGKIIPSSQVQTIQNLEGGIIAEILVDEGTIVDKDQILLRIDNTQMESQVRDLKQQAVALEAAVTRLEAEVSDKPVENLNFSEELQLEAPEVIATEMALYKNRQLTLGAQVDSLKAVLEGSEQEVVAATKKLPNLQTSYNLAQEELQILEKMEKEKTVSSVDLLRKKREVNDLASEIDNVRSMIPRAEAAVKEAKARLDEKLNSFRSEAVQQLGEYKVKLRSIQESLTADRDKVRRTEVRSPVKGTVKEMKVRTIGGVVRPGQDLIEIVPMEDTLLIEARIKPTDIAFIHPEQKAIVRVTAYDYNIYGGLEAEVERISADAIEDPESRESFFRIYLRTKVNHLGDNQKKLPIIPGMTASVDILTGQKTLLNYLLQPILQASSNALRER
ncbi:MAG: HlyD family type I secretion periplasmic adaptor subunit [Alphaproteobacteria bacterium]|nr:HlyD family type I secretion periplasmic adaptor subunit [Alphaproteobacteria bacterium]